MFRIVQSDGATPALTLVLPYLFALLATIALTIHPLSQTTQLGCHELQFEAISSEPTMQMPRVPHRWPVTPKQAIAIQRQLATLVRQAPLSAVPRFVAGLDAAFSLDDACCLAGVVVWDMVEQAVVEQHVAARPLRFPYVPGLLSFREGPAVLAVLRKLRTQPNVFIFDGHGFAHPRRFGIACHIGVILNRPSIGCAKSRLIGTYHEPGPRRGAVAPLIDDGEVIGSVLRTQDGVSPVFVSVGHLIDLSAARRIVLGCAVRYRLPEPTRLADQLVGAAKRQREMRTTPVACPPLPRGH